MPNPISAIECLQKALTLDEKDAIAHSLLGTVYLLQRQHDKAIAEGQKAISFDPSYADGYAHLSHIMRYSGRFEEVLTLIENWIRLCPNPRVFYPWQLGFTMSHWDGTKRRGRIVLDGKLQKLHNVVLTGIEPVSPA